MNNCANRFLLTYLNISLNLDNVADLSRSQKRQLAEEKKKVNNEAILEIMSKLASFYKKRELLTSEEITKFRV